MPTYLDKYLMRQAAKEIFQGFTYGSILIFNVLANVLLLADQLQAQLKYEKKIKEGRVIGPLSHPLCPIFTSPYWHSAQIQEWLENDNSFDRN